jgi:hypothetical protein
MGVRRPTTGGEDQDRMVHVQTYDNTHVVYKLHALGRVPNFASSYRNVAFNSEKHPLLQPPPLHIRSGGGTRR